MTTDPNRLISGYLDSTLTANEQSDLNNWVKADPSNANRFALAVLLDDRIHVHYRSVKATLDELGCARGPAVPRKRYVLRVSAVACAICILVAGLIYFSIPNAGNGNRSAAAVFHNLVNVGLRSADRTFRVSFVNDDDQRDGNGPMRLAKDPGGPNAEKWLYIRNGRQFVCTWKAPDGRDFVTGSNESESWSIRPGETTERNRPMHFTGGLPSSEYLAPILNTFEQQEKILVAFYTMEVRDISSKSRLLVAGKKPDTKQGPRRIEVYYEPETLKVTELRIWPETPDHRRINYTKIELVSDQPLAANWFTADFHIQILGALDMTGSIAAD